MPPAAALVNTTGEDNSQDVAVFLETEHNNKNEALMAQLEKCENEQEFIHEQLATKQAEKEKLSERHAVLQRSMNQCDTEQSKGELQYQNLQQQANHLDRNLAVVIREHQKLEEGIAVKASTQTAIRKAQKNLIKTAAQLQGAIHEKEIETSSMQNELARTRVDSLNYRRTQHAAEGHAPEAGDKFEGEGQFD
jgi:chromosome segregation ATPase